MTPKISVIIPVYNVADYLDKCLWSVTNQTFKELEIIIVNDGSTDNSPEIIARYASKDPRIKVINKPPHAEAVWQSPVATTYTTWTAMTI